MKARDIASQLQILLPQLTDKVTTDVSLASLTRSGTTLTAVALEKHNLKVGDAVNLTGAVTPLACAVTRSGVVGTLVTTANHDVSGNVFGQVKTVTISGAVEAEFNGTFTLLTVENRTTLTFTMADSGPTTATGSPVLETGASALQDYNTLYAVTRVVSATTFEIEQSDTTRPDPIGTIVARVKPRITVAVDPQRAQASYTEQKLEKLWLFVVLDDASASKSRDTRSDAISNDTSGTFYRQQVVQSFSIFVMVPTDESASGMAGRDEAEDLFRPLCRSLLASKFDSGLAIGSQGLVQFNTHGAFSYDVSIYVHQFAFEQTNDLSEGDTVGPDLDVALRDIVSSITPRLGSGGALSGGTGEDPFSTDTINLDDAP